MTALRTLLAAGTLMVLTAAGLSAQSAKVTCTDGSASAGGRGACSGHGGIMTAAMKAKVAADAKAAKKAEKAAAIKVKADAKVAAAKVKADAKAAKVEVKADAKADAKAARGDEHEARGATAECKDHTYSHAASHQGACSRHGGVAKFLTGR